ncbi:MAG: amidohydrolase family protein [Candidatus Shapirobacteria bacterium]
MRKALLKIPGMIDTHVHLRDPGNIDKEDFYTGTCAALAGGVVIVLDMPNNSKPTVNFRSLKQKERIASQKAVCDYGFFLGASQSNYKYSSLVAKRACGLKIYLDSTHGPLLTDKLQTLIGHFENWNSKKPICVHAEDLSVAKILGLAALYKKAVHFCHISQSPEISAIARAKKKGLPVTCEVTPHHLFLTQNDERKLGNFGKMKPPLRTRKDQDALWQALSKGIIDTIGSDHAPHTKKEKKSNNPPFGVPGLETTLPLLLTAVNRKRLSLKKLVQLTSENPRKIFGLKQQSNTNYVLIDLNEKWKIPTKGFQTKCNWSPFANFPVQGRVKEVWIRNKKVWDGKKVLIKPGFGNNLLIN